MTNSNQLTITKKSDSTIVRPLVDPENAVLAFTEYQELSKKIETEDDIQDIGGKKFRKKSFWRKVKKFFGLNLELVKEDKIEKLLLIRNEKTTKKGKYGEYIKINKIPLGYYPIDYEFKNLMSNETVLRVIIFEVTYRATAPNNQYCDGDGACSTFDNGDYKSWHDARATAHTRAKNRAISDIAGFGEVSAEEVSAAKNNDNYNSNSNGMKNVTPRKDDTCEHLKKQILAKACKKRDSLSPEIRNYFFIELQKKEFNYTEEKYREDLIKLGEAA